MRKEILAATLLYFLSVIILLSGLYLFLEENGFHQELFLMGAAIFLFLSLIIGYILNSFILSNKFKIDETLLHLTKEILHEINIPISTIRANSTLLKKSLLTNEKSLKRLSRIDASTERLERLYAELVYGIKKEIHIIEKEKFLLDELIFERVEVMKLLNRNTFTLTLDATVITADKIGFEKMLDNLLSNAMKYSSKESNISIDLKEKILTITDQGIGMDETELIAIYERYYQFDKKVYGEGIGLALVKAYCDDEKIKIRIESEKEVGTKVILNLSLLMFQNVFL